MRAVVQRVRSANVTVAGETVGAIDHGLLILLGVAREDTRDDGEWLAEKLAKLRLFADATGRMNANLSEAGGRALVVSQFTLLASTRKGTRPSWDGAAPPDIARGLYEEFLGQFEVALGERVERGVFGADMQVALINDGPVTLIIDSRTRE